MAAATLRQLEANSKIPYYIRRYIKNSVIGPNLINQYACVLAVCWQGYDALGQTYGFQGKQAFSVSQSTIDYVQDVLYRHRMKHIVLGKATYTLLGTYIRQTPGWQQMTSKMPGGGTGAESANPNLPHTSKVGFLGFQLPMLPNTPSRGPNANVPPLCEQLLNRIHPKFVEGIESFCELIRSRAYLALPAMAFGSLQRVIKGVLGIVGAFQRVINSIYQGALRIIQQFYAYINGILNEIRKWIVWLIEQLIPLDLICEILEAVQVLLDDINFFTSLFSQSAAIFGFLNQIQNFINIASGWVNLLRSDPLVAIFSFLPPEVQQIYDLVNQIGTDPNGFITDQLTNFGYSWAAEALQGNLIAALVDKFGAQYRAIGPISSLINGFGLGTPAPYYPPNPNFVTPSWIAGSDYDSAADTNMNPIQAVYKIVQDTGDNIQDAIAGVGDAFSGLGDTLRAEGRYIRKIPSQISEALGAIF